MWREADLFSAEKSEMMASAAHEGGYHAHNQQNHEKDQ
jgi:hypothetical protein